MQVDVDPRYRQDFHATIGSNEYRRSTVPLDKWESSFLSNDSLSFKSMLIKHSVVSLCFFVQVI